MKLPLPTMKKHHYLLLLLFVGIAAYLLNETRKLKGGEAIASEELKLLRDAIKRSSGAAKSSSFSVISPGSRPPVIDPKEFMAALAGVLQSGPGAESGGSLNELTEKYDKQLTSAPASKLREICELIEKDFPLDQVESEMARQMWLALLGIAAKSDPAWAITKLDQAASTTQSPVTAVLDTFKRWASQNGEPMCLAHAVALQKWLDAAQVTRRIDESDPLFIQLRANIAAAQGDSSAAVKQIARLPYQSQRQAAIDHVQGLQTPETQRQAMEELSTVLDVNNFPYFVKSLSEQQGFDAAREILESATMTPEKHDLAAAAIASAKIGPETKDHAAWLLENLRSDDRRALDLFASSWTEGNFTEAANWIATMQPGPRRDAALKGFVPTAARIDGATAMDWALTVSDPLLRNMLYCEAHENWKKTDPEQANPYHDAHPLDMEALEAAGK